MQLGEKSSCIPPDTTASIGEPKRKPLTRCIAGLVNLFSLAEVERGFYSEGVFPPAKLIKFKLSSSFIEAMRMHSTAESTENGWTFKTKRSLVKLIVLFEKASKM